MADTNLYTTERKEEVRRLGRQGEVEVYYRIWATSRGGTYYHVDVREDQLDQAPQLLAAKARTLDAI